VYLLLERGNVRYVGLLVLLAVGLRWLAPGAPVWFGASLAALGAAFALVLAVTDSELLARLYPVAVSGAMLVIFALTLWRPPSMIERIARASGPELDAAGVCYTRRLTLVWCGFFLANGLVALGTAGYASRETWVLYNGLVSYGLAATLLIGERLLRGPLVRRLAADPGR
jgi:uncharacterized membrane protein